MVNPATAGQNNLVPRGTRNYPYAARAGSSGLTSADLLDPVRNWNRVKRRPSEGPASERSTSSAEDAMKRRVT